MTESKEIFFSDLIDDYYSECDEYLAAIRRALLTLESNSHQDRIDGRAVDDLFRSFHTIKGLSGMVSLREAEQLSHQVENFLRALRKNLSPLSAEQMGTLLDSAQLLEQVITAHRLGKPGHDLTSIAARLEESTSRLISAHDSGASDAPAASGQTSSADRLERMQEAVAKGARLWRLEFTPDASLAAKGITVNTIRARLLEVGEIISAVPEVTESQGIKFIFLAAGFQGADAFAALSEVGVKVEPYALALASDENPEPSSAPADDSSTHPAAMDEEGIARSVHSLAPAHIVRVDLARLDQLIEILSSLVIGRAHLEHHLKRIESMVPSVYRRPLQDASAAMERRLRELRQGIMGLRMVPIGDVFERMRFAIYDLCRKQRKKVTVDTHGEETEIDKYVVEQMIDPLLHIVRNALSHGIEPEEERIAAGKPATGSLRLNASTSGNFVIIEVEDDGRGIDPEMVLTAARRQGLDIPERYPESEALLTVLSETGFTTLAEANVTSGRGVGMAIVKRAVQELAGIVELDSRAGKGSRFTIRLPVTLAIVPAAIVSAGGQTFAVPMSLVREVAEVNPKDVAVCERNEMIKYRAGVLPLVRLAQLFGLRERYTGSFYALIVGSNSSSSGLAVDRLLGHREIVVRTLADPLLHVPGVSGATELGDGKPVLILEPAALLAGKAVRRRATAGVLPGARRLDEKL